MIKPEFFTSSQVAECSHDARLTFLGLLCFSDDSGIHPADYRRLKMELYPGDDCRSADVKAWITELICVGLIEEYQACDLAWWIITGWSRHQCINRPTYRYPTPDGIIPKSNKHPPHNYNDSVSAHGILSEQSNTERNGTDGNGTRPSVRSNKATDHFERWSDADALAKRVERKLWPARGGAPTLSDHRLILRSAVLSLTVFSDGWLADAVKIKPPTSKRFSA